MWGAHDKSDTATQVLEQCLDSGAMKGSDRGDNGEAAPLNPSKRLATLRAASQVSSPVAFESLPYFQ